MSFWNRLFGTNTATKEQRSSLENPSVSLVEWLNGGNVNKSGANVTQETSKSVSAAWRCISLISSGTASLPVGVYEKTDKGRVFLYDNSITKLLKEPSNLYTGFTFFENLIMNLLMQGNGIALIKRKPSGEIMGLELPTKPIDAFIYEGRLMYKMEGVDLPYFSDDVIHVVGFGGSPIWGKSPIQVHAENLGISLASQNYAATYFGNGGHVGGVLMSDKQLKPEQKREIALDWKRKYGGDNQNSTAVLDLGFKYQPIGSKPQESQLLEARKFQVEEISRAFFGVPLHLLNSMDRATFNNIEVMNASYVQHTLTPVLERTEAELTRKLISKDKKSRQEIRFNLDALMRGDMDKRSDYYNKMLMIAAMSPNEIRKAEGLPTYEGGDVYYRPLNMEAVGQKKVSDETE